MYYYIYKITNTMNENFYIGRRQSELPPELDSYFGSGKILNLAIKKYGKEHFIKEILYTFDTEEELITAEKRLVNEAMVLRKDCYNIAIGGHGGFTYYKDRLFQHTNETKKKISNANKGRKRPDLIERMKLEDSTTFKHYWDGKTRSQDDRDKKRLATELAYKEGRHPAKIMIKCPHCSIEMGVGNAKRWHFDNCKGKKYEP
jgi:group I intron endonuclease